MGESKQARLRRNILDRNTDVRIDIESVSVSFGEQSVVRDININIEPGEIFVIMGASGAGKSVLLKCISGLLKPNLGIVKINGMDASERETHYEINSTLVFQAGALFNSLTVFDNLAFFPREHKLYKESEITEKVLETLRILSLDHAAYKIPAELSGGMRKRVAIARALMCEADMIMYDEPTSELDPVMAATISEIIANVRDQFGLTSVVVSHDRDLAYGIADRVAIIHKGELLAVDSPENIQNDPNPLVQDFLNPTINIDDPRFKKLETV